MNFSLSDHLVMNVSHSDQPFLGIAAISSYRAQKMLQNDVLDVEKLFDTAENGPLQIPQIRNYGYSALSLNVAQRK